METGSTLPWCGHGVTGGGSVVAVGGDACVVFVDPSNGSVKQVVRAAALRGKRGVYNTKNVLFVFFSLSLSFWYTNKVRLQEKEL